MGSDYFHTCRGLIALYNNRDLRKTRMAKSKQEPVRLWTAAGRFSFPFFVSPDEGRTYSDGAYKTDLLIPKAVFKESGKALQEAVLKIGKEAFGPSYTLKSDKWRSPFRDTDSDDKIENEAMKGCILIRAKSGKRKDKPAIQPVFIGPKKGSSGKFDQLTKDEIAAIKGGDWGKMQITVFAYEQSGGGVTFALNAIQFWKAGEAFGQGRTAVLESAEELEVELDDADTNASAEIEDSII
jgi:hypothetical protein